MREVFKIVLPIVLVVIIIGGLLYIGINEIVATNKKYSPVINGEEVSRDFVPKKTLEIVNETLSHSLIEAKRSINLAKDVNKILEKLEASENEVAELRKEVATLKSEVMRGISLIPSTIKVEKPQPDQDRLAVIKVINDKLNVVATNAVTKEDLEKLKASVMQVLEENKAIKAEKEAAVPAAPPVVLPSLSEEFPKK